jgi:membrane protein involved in colicin uptake
MTNKKTETPEEVAAREANEAAEAAEAAAKAAEEAEAAEKAAAEELALAEQAAEVARQEAEQKAADEERAMKVAEAEAEALRVAAIAESNAEGLNYIVNNFRITHDYRMPGGNTRTVAFNEGDIIHDDGGPNTLPHDSIMSLLASGHIRPEVAKEE